MEQILLLLNQPHHPSTRQEMQTLWNQYEDKSTPESMMVHDLDKFDMVLQAFDYEQRFHVDLDSFFHSTENFFRSDCVRRWDADVREKRRLIKGQRAKE